MLQLPQPLIDYICNHVVEQYCPAYLRVDQHGIITTLGGDLKKYGLLDLQVGLKIEEKLDFLAGLLPLAEGPIFLPMVKYEPSCSCSMDIHLFPAPEGDWILLLDANDLEAQQLEFQQQGNYLALQTQAQKQHLSRLFQKSGLAPATLDGSHLMDVSVLSISISPLMDPDETLEAMQMVRAIEAYFASITMTIVESAGIVTAQLGNTMLAIFGPLPTPSPSAQTAVEVGLRILRQPQQDARINVGGMITSGASVLGSLRGNPYQSLGLISPQMPEIMRLTSYIRPQELMIDAQTLKQLTADQTLFTRSQLYQDPSIATPIYSCTP
jgi:class 3 adenylate cyclase